MDRFNGESTGGRLRFILLVLLGILFGAVWISAHIALSYMALIANLMANDSGHASLGQHMSLMCGILGGQIVAGSAGIPGGLAFFWRGKRKWLLGTFAVLFLSGAILQVLALDLFFTD
jgi:hypothetical protein